MAHSINRKSRKWVDISSKKEYLKDGDATNKDNIKDDDTTNKDDFKNGDETTKHDLIDDNKIDVGEIFQLKVQTINYSILQ